ncbi:MAG: CDC48 family AAA ATPase [Halodesulfurarchaeum sp.]
MSETRSREVVVREAEPRDAGRGIVRLPRPLMRDLGVLSGETVRIEGEGVTVARVWPGRDDLETDELRADGEIRANASVSVGDTVTVGPVDIEEAERVELVPTVDPGREESAVVDALERTLKNRPVRPGERVKIESLGDVGEFRVVGTEPSGTVRVTTETAIRVSEAGASGAEVSGVGVTYEDIGGLDEELEAVRELVELPLADPGVFRRLGIEPPKGVLMYGPPGTGKTLIARAVANEANAHFIHVSGPEIVGKYKGESEERLRQIFEEAESEAPSIVFFDELDAIAPQREDGGDMESRVVAQLLSLMDGLEARGEVVVIGATNRVDTIDPALRRPGRFDREVEIGVPDRTGRREILDIHTRGTPVSDAVDLDRIAERTHGFVGADLRALVAEAAMHALRRARESGALHEVTVAAEDFDRALSAVEPSAMREFVAELPETSFSDVGGLHDAKETLREAVEWPLRHRDLFEATATDPPSGILLYGPPGTGKTMLARAVAHEGGVNFIRVAGPELYDRYVGESERAIREVFERARQAAPTVVFFDELDAIAAERGGETHEVTERVVSQLLTELDSAADDPNLVVLAATNRMEALDRALLRPGRLELHVHVPEPDREARREILSVHTREKPLADDVDLDDLAARLDGRTGADIAAIVREASMQAIREVAERREGSEAGEEVMGSETAEPADASAPAVAMTTDHFDRAIEALDAGGPIRDRR